MSFWTLLVLGLIAGGTILIGLLMGRLCELSTIIRTALSVLVAGILVFLLVEIIGEAIAQTVASVRNAADGAGSVGSATLMIVLLLSGFSLALLASLS